jgi:hypothetical protein
MKASKEFEKIVGWAQSTQTSAARRGMLIEVKNGKVLVINREHTVALLTTVGGNENLRFYSDEYPMGKYPEITSEGDNTVFTWMEEGQRRRVSFPATTKSFFDEMMKTFEDERKRETLQTYKTSEFTKLLDDMKFTTLEITGGGLKLIQTDPRGIVSETEIRSEAGTTSKVDRW